MVSEILNDIQTEVASLELIPSDGGRFEWTVDGELVYSKAATGRYPELVGAQGGGLREAARGVARVAVRRARAAARIGPSRPT